MFKSMSHLFDFFVVHGCSPGSAEVRFAANTCPSDVFCKCGFSAHHLSKGCYLHPDTTLTFYQHLIAYSKVDFRQNGCGSSLDHEFGLVEGL